MVDCRFRLMVWLGAKDFEIFWTMVRHPQRQRMCLLPKGCHMWFESITGGRWLARAFQKRCPPLSDRVTLQAPWQQIFLACGAKWSRRKKQNSSRKSWHWFALGVMQVSSAHANSKFLDNSLRTSGFRFFCIYNIFFFKWHCFSSHETESGSDMYWRHLPEKGNCQIACRSDSFAILCMRLGDWKRRISTEGDCRQDRPFRVGRVARAMTDLIHVVCTWEVATCH